MFSRNAFKKIGNRLLDWLPSEELDRLRPLAERVSLSQAEELCRQNGPLSHVYFPLSGIYAAVIRLEDGRIVEASAVGNEGVIGVTALLGLRLSPKTATTPVPGECLRFGVEVLRAAARPGTVLDRVMNRYAAYALRNAYQSVACNAVHTAANRICRWLLASQDKVGTEPLRLTHEILAEFLGVRRQTVSVITGHLQDAGCITSRHGVVRILNRNCLEERSCECYHVARLLYEQIVHASETCLN